MPKKSDEAEDRLREALEAYSDRDKPKIKPIAREFGVDYQRLHRRVRGGTSRSARQVPNKALNEPQEQALVSYVDILYRANLPPTPADVEATANEILERSGSTRRVGHNWAYRFLKRHPNHYVASTQKTMDAERMDAERLPLIEDFFHRLDVILQWNKVGPKNIYNMDETGFQLGQGKSQRVASKSKDSIRPIPTGGIAETVTAVECIAADGWLMPPMILFAGSVHLENWYRNQPDLPDDYILGTSETGWNNEVSA
jgi:hypothetical protein